MNKTGLSQLAQRTTEPPISWLMKLALDQPDLISLAAGFTDNESLPVKESRELLEDLLASPRRGRPSLQYGTTVGDARLRELTAAHLQKEDRARRGAETHAPARVLITSGSQQLLYMTVEALCDPGDIVLVEDPTYFVFLGITQSHGLQCRGVQLAPDGIDLDHLLEVLKRLERSGDLRRVKMLYLVSYFQNPTGRTTAFRKKQAALEILQRFERRAGHPIYLVEDAAYRELRFAGDDEPSALMAGFPDRVIYAGTYSKPFATGVRVGFGVLPEPLFTAVARIKGNHDFGTANLLQQLLARALSQGAYDAHLPVLRKRYAAKAVVMARALRSGFPPEVQWEEPRGGLYIWARLPSGMKTGMRSRLFQSALARRVLYVPGELCYCDDPARAKPRCEMRLSFGSATVGEITAGISRLAGALREA